MFGIGLPEMIIIAAVALVFIGPDKLPGVLRSLGKGLVELKRATSDVRSTVQDEMHKIEEEIELKDVRKSAEDFSNELGGVANKMDPLSLSKMRPDEQLDKIADAIENTEIDESTLESNEEVTSTRSNSAGISAGDFPEPETVEESPEELATVEKSTADKT
ncbi:MAG: twin-arginine translocase TatA/TatE family subunit [SAR324 cluster bacterium]|nr:twin-arginine translocase TatA/TatE family subunit [SAR324 cluster bacterium]